MAHTIPYSGLLRSERIRIPREGDIFRTTGDLYLLLSTKRTKIVVSRHDFWAQYVSKMLLQSGLSPESRWCSSRRSPDSLAKFWGPLRGRKWKGTGKERRRGTEGERGERKVEGRREGEGGEGRNERGKEGRGLV